jgi:hypothetical protein
MREEAITLCQDATFINGLASTQLIELITRGAETWSELNRWPRLQLLRYGKQLRGLVAGRGGVQKL